MVHNVVQFGNILCTSFESFGEVHFRPTFDAGAVQRCIAIVRSNTMPIVWLGLHKGRCVGEGVFCGMRIAECGKMSTGNLRKIRCGFFSAE